MRNFLAKPIRSTCFSSYCLLVIFIIFCLTTSVKAQLASVTIKGTITDSTTLKPIEFVTLRLFKENDRKRVLATILSKEDGNYLVKDIQPGVYLLSFTHSAYREKEITLTISETVSQVDVAMLPHINVLSEIIIKSRKPLVTEEDDRTVYNVGDDPSVSGSFGIEAIRKAPFVSVDGNGGITVNGKPARILLNGKTTGIIASNPSEVLKIFPADLIKKIEVITNPSAKYEADGFASVINIITKKFSGYTGGLGLHHFSWGQSQLSIAPFGSLKLGAFGLSFYGGHSATKQKVNTTSDYKTSNPSSPFAKRNMKSTGITDNSFQWGSMELSWDLDSLSSISGYGSLNGTSNQPTLYESAKTYKTNNQLLTESIFETFQDANNPNGDLGVDFIKKFKKNKNQQLTISTNWQWENIKNNTTSNQFNTNTSNRFIINENTGRNRQITFQSDFTLPITSNKSIEIGIKGIYRNVQSNYRSLLLNNTSNIYEPDNNNTDNFRYKQNVSSGYIVYRFRHKKTSLMPGIRFEHTNLSGDFLTNISSVTQSYANIFPTLTISSNLGKGKSLRFSYARRISRPGIKYLNPFINNYDSLNISYGNPDLGPEFRNNIELAFSIAKTGFSFSFSVLYAKESNQIFALTRFDQSKGITSSTYNNATSTNRFGFAINSSVSKKKISGNLILNMSFNHLNTKTTPKISNDGMSGYGNLNFAYRLTNNFRFRYSSSLLLPTILPQGEVNAYYYYQFQIELLTIKKKLTLLLALNRPFTRYWTKRTIIEDQKNMFYRTSHELMPYRTLQMGAILNIGKLKENVSRKRGVTVDDAKN